MYVYVTFHYLLDFWTPFLTTKLTKIHSRLIPGNRKENNVIFSSLETERTPNLLPAETERTRRMDHAVPH